MRHLSSMEVLETINGDGNRAEHLKECKLCLDRAASFAKFASSAKRVSYLNEKPSDGCLTPDEIADIVEGKTKNAKGRSHLSECEHCFKNAAYYYSQSMAMEREMTGLDVTVPQRYIEAAKGIPHSTRASREVRVDSKKVSWIDKWVFAPFPAYATAALLIITIWTAPANMTIAEIAGGDSYTVYKKTANGIPYLYFGDTGKATETIEASMKAVPMKREVHFSWSEVPNVDEYLFVLQDITEIAPKTIVQLSTKKSFVKIPWKRIEEGKRYRWITAGGISKESYFRGEAGFQSIKKR